MTTVQGVGDSFHRLRVGDYRVMYDVIPEDQALDQQTLPKVKMPIGDNYAALPDWKPRTKRLQGYPF